MDIATTIAHFVECMRVARHDHMIKSPHVVSIKCVIVIGRGVLHWFCRPLHYATALLKRGSIPAGIYCGIDMDRCKRILKTLPISQYVQLGVRL